MKKETKASLIIFCVVLVVAYIMTCFIPDEILVYNNSTSALGFLSNMAVAAVGMRGIIALAIALIVTLLIRIVDSNDVKGTKKVEKK